MQIDVTIEDDLHLREMETKIEGTVTEFWGDFAEEEIRLSETKTYDELAITVLMGLQSALS